MCSMRCQLHTLRSCDDLDSCKASHTTPTVSVFDTSIDAAVADKYEEVLLTYMVESLITRQLQLCLHLRCNVSLVRVIVGNVDALLL